MAGRIVELDVSSATVELAARALGCKPERIAKTLSFKAGDGCILVAASGDARISNQKFKQTFGFKAKMLSPDEVLSMTGHAVGGVCPFGVPPEIPVYLDESLRRFDFVFPACGSANSVIKLSIDELFSLSRAQGWIDVCSY